MLDIGGVIECRIYNGALGLYQIFIPATLLGIEPGETFLANYKYYHEGDSEWYIKLYATKNRKYRHKRKYYSGSKISEGELKGCAFYNEMTKFYEDEVTKEGWFTQDIKASILLPIIKERSKFPNSLIYVDEYWRT